jgi:dTDP-4-dehydrorhamnose 3,5-epimerase
VIKAWHRHRRQTDFWICIHGHVKTGIYRQSDGVAWISVTGERKPGVIVIPPGLWHGVTPVGPDPAGLLYYVTEQYDAEHPDEQRWPHDRVPDFPWKTQHG